MLRRMNQAEAFLLALALLVGGTLVARAYLSDRARLLLALVAALAHLA